VSAARRRPRSGRSSASARSPAPPASWPCASGARPMKRYGLSSIAPCRTSPVVCRSSACSSRRQLVAIDHTLKYGSWRHQRTAAAKGPAFSAATPHSGTDRMATMMADSNGVISSECSSVVTAVIITLIVPRAATRYTASVNSTYAFASAATVRDSIGLRRSETAAGLSTRAEAAGVTPGRCVISSPIVRGHQDARVGIRSAREGPYAGAISPGGTAYLASGVRRILRNCVDSSTDAREGSTTAE